MVALVHYADPILEAKALLPICVKSAHFGSFGDNFSLSACCKLFEPK